MRQLLKVCGDSRSQKFQDLIKTMHCTPSFEDIHRVLDDESRVETLIERSNGASTNDSHPPTLLFSQPDHDGQDVQTIHQQTHLSTESRIDPRLLYSPVEGKRENGTWVDIGKERLSI